MTECFNDLDREDKPYWERNQLVLYLSKIYPSWLERHNEYADWEDAWRNIVFIDFPEGHYSWHIHDKEMKYFEHLEFKVGDSWDGSSTQEKYDKLRMCLCMYK